MFRIAHHQMVEGLIDAKYLFFGTLILLAFLVNAFVYSDRYEQARDDYREALAETNNELESSASNLQGLAMVNQQFVQPPSPLAFIAEGGERFLPNAVLLNAFGRYALVSQHRGNPRLPIVLPLDWSFIIGVLMTLLTVLLGFSAVAGEKSSGTLRVVLSNPVSRLQLFAGKYLGLLAVLVIALLLGVATNLVTIAVLGSVPLTVEIFWAIGWAVLLSVLCLSAFLLTSMAVSSMTSHPPVALVVLLVVWVTAVVAMPGIGRLTAEQITGVPSRDVVKEEEEKAGQAAWDSHPAIAGKWTGRASDDHVKIRAAAVRDMVEAEQRVRDRAVRAQVRQALMVQTLCAPSPPGLLSDSLQALCGTGVYGFQSLLENAERYRRELHSFVVERDKLDPDTPHLVYGSDTWVDRGTYSREAVPFTLVPTSDRLWRSTGFAPEREWPAWQALLMLAFNLLAGFVAFVALLRYDPR